MLIAEIREDAEKNAIDEIRAYELEAKELADERARLIVSAAIQRYASSKLVTVQFRCAFAERRDEGAYYRSRGSKYSCL